MTEAERQALIEDITNAVMTKLNENSVDWSSHTITFGDRYDIQVNERQNIKIPAIDKRNGITYGNLDLNTLLTAFGLTQAMKSASDAEKAGNDAVTNIENAKDSAMSAIDSKTESEKADISTHANAERGTISSATSNAISSIQQARDSANSEVSSTATSKKNELNAIVATGISNIQQTVTSTEDDGNNEITITLNNGTTKKFTVQNGSQGSQGIQGIQGDTGVSVVSVVQTTTSTDDDGNNVITVTLSNGQTSTFTIQNGSKGSQGIQGIQGVTGNGISSITVSESTADGGNNVVTINMTNGTSKTFNVKNGSKGADGSSGGGSSDVSLKLIAGSENATGSGGYDTNSDADLNAFIETGMVKWAKYRNISGLPNADGLVQSIGWRSPLDGAGWGRQIAYDDESNNIYSRYMGNGSWSAWTKVLVAGDSAPASDVYAWAKASTKPKYTASEVGASASGHSHSEYKVVTNYAHGTTGTKTLSAIAVNQMGFFSYRFDGSGGSVKLPSGGTYLAMTFYNQGDESNHVTFSKSSYVSLSGGATIASINPDNDLNSSYAYCYGIYIRKS